jgi:putative peptidoglycan lipid II flippase
VTSNEPLASFIVRSSLGVAGIIVAVKALAMFKEMVVAYYFGTSAALDAYLIAFLLPSLAVNVFGASFQSALIPALIGASQTGQDADRASFISACFTRYLMALVVLTGALAVIAPLFIEILGDGFASRGGQRAGGLALLLLPVFFFGSLSAFFAGILAARKKFLLSASIPALTSVITILLLVTLAGRWGIDSLAIGVVAGFGAEALVLAVVVFLTGDRLRMAWSPWSGRIRGVFQQTGHIAIGAALMSGTMLVDQSIATWLDEGAVATLSYATRLTAVLLTIAASLSTVSLPYFSELVESRNWTALRHTVARLGGAVVLGSTILVACVVVFSVPITELMFERGSFLPDDTRRVAWVQAVFVLQMPFYILVQIGMRFLYALKRGDLVLWASVAIFAANFLGNVLLVQIWGVAGIALATVISYLIGAVFLLFSARNLAR